MSGRLTSFFSVIGRLAFRFRHVGRSQLLTDLVVFAGTLTLYVSTLSPSVYTFDSAELAAGAYALGIVHATGYPVYLVLAKLFTLIVPLGDIAFRVNLFSALCAALGLVMLRRVMFMLTRSYSSALLATSTFGVSYPLWSEAVVAEVYTLHVLFMTSMLWLALQWRATGRARFVILLGLIFGLSLGNHMSTVLLAPGLAYFFWTELRRQSHPRRVWWLAPLAATIGPLSYLYLPVRSAAHPALNYAAALGVDLGTLDGSLWLMRGAMFADVMFGYRLADIPREMLDFAVLLWQTFFGIGSIVALIGVIDLWRRDRPVTTTLGLLFATTSAFYINYRVFDKDTMFLPTFVVVSLWLAVGLRSMQERAGGAAPFVRGGAVAVIGFMVALNYPRVNLAGNWTTRDYAEQIFRDVPPDSVVVGAWIDITPLEYLQIVEKQRPDVILFDYGLYILGRSARLRSQGQDEKTIQRITATEIRRMVAEELWAGRKVYSLEDNPLLREEFVLIADRHLYLVREHSSYER
ncbi:MAG: DUF2723 domain-containing protein [Chloroflexi bacterium]|nr:DUF2723 domain-containing protein [Chloroflexota bacterium]